MADQFDLYRMPKTETLEELTIKDDLFINSKGKVVKVEPLGEPTAIWRQGPYAILEFTSNKPTILKNAPKGANAYCRGKPEIVSNGDYAIPVQYYKAEVPCDG